MGAGSLPPDSKGLALRQDCKNSRCPVAFCP